MTATVLLTDYAWPDTAIERAIVEGAGYRLVCGPSAPAPVDAIDALIRDTAPAAIMTCWAQVSEEAIRGARDLKIVARMGVGLDNIAVEAATARGAWVTNVPDYCVEEVSDHAVALLLDWARGIAAFDRAVKQGAWEPAAAKLRRVRDLTVGLIGFGHIARRTAAKLAGFGVRLLCHTRTVPAREALPVAFLPLDGLLPQCDAVIVHAPLTEATHHLLDRARLGAMKPGAFLINVSRGGIVDSAALLDALQSGHLSGAGLDVVEGEPAPPRALVERADVIVTPHVAFSSDASLAELRRRVAEEVVRVLRGEAPLHPCNRPLS